MSHRAGEPYVTPEQFKKDASFDKKHSELPLNEDMDASRWAREFVEIFSGIAVGSKRVDEGTMIAWFANAIMCGHDVGRRKLREDSASSAERANNLDPVLRIRNQMAGRAVEWEARPETRDHNYDVPQELRYWVDLLDEAMTLSTPSTVASHCECEEVNFYGTPGYRGCDRRAGCKLENKHV